MMRARHCTAILRTAALNFFAEKWRIIF